MTQHRKGATRRQGLGMAAAALVAALGVTAASLPAAAEEPLKIGFAMAETGPLAGTGKSALLAMSIWAEDVNAKGGLLGRQVKLVHYDDHSNPANVPALYAKLIDLDKERFKDTPKMLDRMREYQHMLETNYDAVLKDFARPTYPNGDPFAGVE